MAKRLAPLLALPMTMTYPISRGIGTIITTMALFFSLSDTQAMKQRIVPKQLEILPGLGIGRDLPKADNDRGQEGSKSKQRDGRAEEKHTSNPEERV